MADVAAQLRDRRAELTALAPDARPAVGRAWCEAWTDAVDAGLRELHADLELRRGRLALVATGGYGRRELCPGSDVDLLLLHDGVGYEGLELAVRHIVYPLWDAALQVGHAVRDHRQTVSMALDDVEAATALLDARTLAGDPDLLRGARDEAIGKLRRRPDRFLGSLADADRDRRQRVGAAAEVLEPDLKRGAGALRDVQSLRWAAAGLLGEVALDALVPAGYVSAPDRGDLSRAHERILAARVGLHLVAERPTDVLRLDLQQQVAELLGYQDGDGVRSTAADLLLRDLFLAARTVDHVHSRAWSLMTADASRGRRRRRPAEVTVDGFEVVDGVLRLGEHEVTGDQVPTRLLHALVESEAVLDARAAATFQRAAAARDEPYPWDAAARGHFLASLWAGRSALRAFAELDHAGLLVALVPEWEPLRGSPQRNPFHTYSLDRHALHAATGLAELVRNDDWAAAALDEVTDRDALMLGVLLHDVGKAHGEPHSETGVPVARAVVRRLGLGEDSADLVETMVRHHLLLPDAATRRDLSDPGLVAEVAQTIGTREALACLHLLAAADGAATGPSAWSSWKASLVSTLVGKVRAVFDDTPLDDLEDSATNTARSAQELGPDLGIDPAAIRAHLEMLPAHYASAVTPRNVARHALLGLDELVPGEVRTRVTPGDDAEGDVAGYDALDVVALDTPGLFAKVAGVLALHGGSVVGAHAFTRSDGVAVDTFTVRTPEHAVTSWWASVEGDLVEAVAGRLALRARVARKAAKAQRRRTLSLPDVPTTVTCSRDASGQTTVVDVHTEDGVGVLFRIVSALAELELDIVVAKISTVGHEVADAFYVRDAAGNPLDEDHAAELVLAVESALAT
ncbi:MAG TPA: [protein-PII] uridylyltransferase [Nitriliruptorales bacterium]